MSRLGIFCERLIEACWLAAIVVAPLFFDIYSSRVFEPDKIALVRTLALVMLAAWLLLRAEIFRVRPRERNAAERFEPIARLRAIAAQWSRENPLTLPTIFLVVIYIISTLASVSPSVSLLGSYQRLQGLYTTLAYITIFFLAASAIRTQAQVDRALNVALAVSFPAALYGIIQHYFLDPLPWGGDVTTRVASTMGNSIFIGAFLIMVIPLALARLAAHTQRAAASCGSRRALVYLGASVSFIALALAWSASFEFGAKPLLEANGGALSPEILASAQANFNLALGVSFVVVLGWWALGFMLKGRAGAFLLIGVYTLLLALQVVCLLFSQSRGPLLGFLGGMFAFVVLYALARGARRGALSVVGLAFAALVFLALFNLPGESPLARLRELPYVGRLGRVFETEGGTGKVRVLIWQGALQLVLPHAPIWSPTTGEDSLNVARPFIGYGPETMYVAYNAFYPPDLAHLESRNATPDRSHNETFDALVQTGLVGLSAESVLFITLFYFGLKWLGLIDSARARNLFVALWLVSGVVTSSAFGLTLGWHFVGVALPAGMIVGFFIYLMIVALRRAPARSSQESPARALLLVTLIAALVAHFVEIHFGIAIVSTRTYFWFFAALLVAVGARRLAQEQSPAALTAAMQPAPASVVTNAAPTRRKRGSKTRAAARRETKPAPQPRAPVAAGSAPLIAFAFLVGFILATLAFDYINTTNLKAGAGENVRALDIALAALTMRPTTAGPQPAFALTWLFILTLLVGLVVSVAEWGRDLVLQTREWLLAFGLSAVIALAVFSSFLFYHTLLIGATGAGAFDALLSAAALYVLFIVIVCLTVAVTLLFDIALPTTLVARPTNWIVAPVLAGLAALLIVSTNVSIVQADIIYKQAAALASGQTLKNSIDFFQRALELQPSQDYYLLFLARSYLEYAKTLSSAEARDKLLAAAEKALKRAQELNPLNTDHTANLARMHQAWAGLAAEPSAQAEHYSKSLDYFAHTMRISPNTAHLYDQYALALLDYALFRDEQGDAAGAERARRGAQEQLARSLRVDATFCLTYAVRARAQDDWQAEARDALTAFGYAPSCGDVFQAEGSGLALLALAEAGERAVVTGAGATFASMVEDAARAQPSLELYTTLANHYSKSGQIEAALRATDAALARLPAGDTGTRERYQEFRKTLVALQAALNAAQAAPNDPEAQRAVARLWMARGQAELALPAYQRVAALLPNDYDAARHVALLLMRGGALNDATHAVTRTLAVAPASERAFWEKLAAILAAAQQGKKSDALQMLDALTKSVDAKDTLTLDVLRTLKSKIPNS